MWPGAIGVDDQGHLIFARPIDGLRAIVICLKKYRDKGLKSPFGIISRWTRGHPGKDRENYIKFVSHRLNCFEWTRLDLYDPVVLESLTKAIVHFENGKDPYPEKLYRSVFPKRMKGT